MGDVKYFSAGTDAIVNNLEAALEDARAGRLKFMYLAVACEDDDGLVYSSGGFAGDIKHVALVLGESKIETHSLLNSLDAIMAMYEEGIDE